jgi:hypothetical protein
MVATTGLDRRLDAHRAPGNADMSIASAVWNALHKAGVTSAQTFAMLMRLPYSGDLSRLEANIGLNRFKEL